MLPLCNDSFCYFLIGLTEFKFSFRKGPFHGTLEGVVRNYPYHKCYLQPSYTGVCMQPHKTPNPHGVRYDPHAMPFQRGLYSAPMQTLFYRGLLQPLWKIPFTEICMQLLCNPPATKCLNYSMKAPFSGLLLQNPGKLLLKGAICRLHASSFHGVCMQTLWKPLPERVVYYPWGLQTTFCSPLPFRGSCMPPDSFCTSEHFMQFLDKNILNFIPFLLTSSPQGVVVGKHDYSVQIKYVHAIPNKYIIFNLNPTPLPQTIWRLWCEAWFYSVSQKISCSSSKKINFTSYPNSQSEYIYVTGSEIRIQNWQDSSCMAVRDDRVGTPTDAQVVQHDSTGHVQGFSHLKEETDDCDVIRSCHCHYAYVKDKGLYKEVHTSLGALIWVFCCSTFGHTWLGATNPLLQLPRCLSRSGTITRKGSVLYLFNCKCLRLSWALLISLL